MISAMLCGGLGGRMFQIATAYALALDNNDECAFDLNMGSLAQGVHPSTYRNNVFAKLKQLDPEWRQAAYYQERRYNYDPIPYQKDLMLGGYFGSERYFSHRRRELIELFKSPEIINRLKVPFKTVFENSVSLHVRRGDYLINASYVCPESYYKEALRRINKEVQIDYIYVVSDDIPWCKSVFKDERIFFVEGVPDYIDFYIQTLCTHNIIANSMFSRMAAFLNENGGKIYAPATWYGGEIANQITDVFLNDWEYL